MPHGNPGSGLMQISLDTRWERQVSGSVAFRVPVASVSQGRMCSDSCACLHTEIEVADQSYCLTQPQYTDTGPTSPSADPGRVATGVSVSKSLV